MDELKLSELISDITFRKIPYCLVCFRLETDRRLVRPKAVAEFLRTTSTPKFAKDKWVCHICERQAERAMRLFRTVRLARDLSAAMWNLAEKNYSSERMLQVLPVHLSINSNRRKEVSPEKLVESMRRLGHLAQTNVLVVNTQGILEVDPLQTDDNGDPPSPDMIILDDDEDTTSVNNSPPTEAPAKEPLEPPPSTPSALRRPSPPPNTQTVLIQSENSGNVFFCTLPMSFTQIPIPTVVQNNTLVIDPTVPLSNIKQRLNVASNDTKCGDVRNVSIAPKPPAQTQLNVGTKLNILTQYNLESKFNAGAQHNAGTKLNATQFNLGTELYTGTQLDVDATRSATDIHELDSALKSIIDDESGNICLIENPVSLKETVDVTDEPPKDSRQLPKMAVMNSSRIDWEDKIPMDVISFVDANDPNAGDMLDGMTLVPDSGRALRKRRARRGLADLE